MAEIFELPDGRIPEISETAWVAPTAVVVGQISLSSGVSVWYNAVLRAETNTIRVGQDSNLQDAVVVHVDPDFPVSIGQNVTVGHSAVIHGATVEDNCLIGMNSTVLNGAVVGQESLIAANALVTPGTVVPPRSLVAGVPGKVVRALTDEEVENIRGNGRVYLGHTILHKQAERR